MQKVDYVEAIYLKSIIFVSEEGLQLFCEGNEVPVAVNGLTEKIPNDQKSWERILENINVKPINLQLKIIWQTPNYEVLRHCMETFSELESLEIETLANVRERLQVTETEEEVGKNFDNYFDTVAAVKNLAQQKTFITNKFKKLQAILKKR